MSNQSQIFDSSMRTAENASARLQNHFAPQVNQEVDLLFARLHTGVTREEQTQILQDKIKYGVNGLTEEQKRNIGIIPANNNSIVQDTNSSIVQSTHDGYIRKGFRTQEEQKNFVDFMTQQGFNVAAADIRVNGQYLVEVERGTVNSDDIVTANPSYNVNSDAAQIMGFTGGSESFTATAEDVISRYSEHMDVDVEEQHLHDYAYDPDYGERDYRQREAEYAGSFLADNMDSFGMAVNHTYGFLKELSSYMGNDTKSEDALYTHSLDIAGNSTHINSNGDAHTQFVNKNRNFETANVRRFKDGSQVVFINGRYVGRTSSSGDIVDENTNSMSPDRLRQYNADRENLTDIIRKDNARESESLLRSSESDAAQKARDDLLRRNKSPYLWTAENAGIKSSDKQRSDFINHMLVKRNEEQEKIKKNAKAIHDSFLHNETQSYAVSSTVSHALLYSGSLINIQNRLAEEAKMLELAETTGKELDTSDFVINDLKSVFGDTDGIANLGLDNGEALTNLQKSLIDKFEAQGIQITSMGNINGNMLNSLTMEQWASIGIKNQNTINTLKQMAGSPVQLSADGSALLGGAVGKLNQIIGDEDLSEMTKHAQNSAKVVKHGRTIGKQFSTSVSSWAEQRSLKDSKNALANALKKMNDHKAERAAQKTANMLAHPNKFANKLAKKKLDFAQKAMNSKLIRYNPFSLYNRAKDRLMKKAAEAAAKLAAKAGLASTGVGAVVAVALEALEHWREIAAAAIIKVAVSAAGLLIPIIGGFILISFVVLNISSLFEDDDIESYKKTAAYHLNNEIIQKSENEWITNLQDLSDKDSVFKDKEKIHFGYENEDFKDYVEKFDNLLLTDVEENDSSDPDAPKLKDSTLNINPFWKVEGLVTEDHNKDALTQVEGFDGALTYKIVANANAFGEKESPDTAENLAEETAEASETDKSMGDDEHIYTENGHTSNGKDILAALDVMYAYEPEEYDDETQGSIFDESPAEINMDYFFKSVANTLKYIGDIVSTLFKNIVSLFTGADTTPLSDVEFKKTGVSYRTLENYTQHLFMASHQETMRLSVNYYDKEVPTIKVKNGSETEDKIITEAVDEAGGKLTNSDAAKLGFCLELEESDFEIDVVKISEASGEDIAADSYGDVQHPMMNQEVIFDEKVTPVLISEDDEVYSVSEDGRFEVTITMDDIKKDKDGNFEDQPCLWHGMKNDKETFEIIRSHKCWENEESREYEHRGDVMSEYAQYGVTFDVIENVPMQFVTLFFTEPITPEGETMAELNTAYILIDKDTFVYLSPHMGKPSFASYGNNMANINYTAEIYKRDCQKHTFEYSGGQIDLETVGRVYSIMNEHLYLVGQYNEDWEYPIVIHQANGVSEPDEERVSDMGFDEIRGKIDVDSVDYTTPVTAHTSGGGKSPVEDIQGTYAGMTGVNFYIVGDGSVSDDAGNKSKFGGTSPSTTTSGAVDYSQWGRGFAVRKDFKENVFLCRDIFDIDMMIEKGRNVFPFNKEEFKNYEAWSADNMTLAATRITGDWYQYFNYDIPMEIGERTLSEVDIDAIMESVGSAGLSTERETAARIALSWVGHGHYSEDHTDHDFLLDLCKATPHKVEAVGEEVGWDANCTAANSEGFAKYVYNYASNGKDLGSGQDYSGKSAVQTGDIIVHKGEGETDAYKDLIFEKKDLKNFTADSVADYGRDYYSIVIGTTSTEVETIGHITIPSGSFITVDMDTNGVFGTVRLRFLDSDGYFAHFEGVRNKKGLAEDDPKLADCLEANKDKDYNRTNFYWITNPDDKTKYIPFGN